MATKPELERNPRTRAARVVRELVRLYPSVRCALDHRDAFELLAATVLSAQCTDERVNQVTPALFARFPDPASLAGADITEVETLVFSTGFYRNKAKNLIALSQALVSRHDGVVPADHEALTALPGVGRKTANVVMGCAFEIASGVVVDTHVKRLAFRLGLTSKTDPQVIELELNDLLPKKQWIAFSHLLITHGRAVCDARSPRCPECSLLKVCPRQGLEPLEPRTTAQTSRKSSKAPTPSNSVE